MESVEKIIKGCIKKKRNAQKHLYDMFSSKMYGICLRYAKNYHDAQDILHDGFLIVFEKINTYKNKGSFEGWIRRIMINTAIQQYRERISHLDAGELEKEEPATEYHWLHVDDLIKKIQALPAQYRIVFNMYAVEGYSHKEIADILNISENTSRSNYSRARNILRDKLNKEIEFYELQSIALK